MTMMPAPSDLAFQTAFEEGTFPAADFDHRQHLRLAFVYLCQGDVRSANTRMRAAILNFLTKNGAPTDKFHETITTAWLQAVRHFMHRARSASSFDEFLNHDDRLLDTRIMLSHYRAETLFSDTARKTFVAPDLQAIPQYS